MDGDRSLTIEMAGRFAEAMGLRDEAAEYFVQLVRFCQAKRSVERSRAYDKLSAFSAFRKTRKLDLAQADYHAHWYVPAIRELAGRHDFVAEPRWIAARLLPPVKPVDVRAALDTLQRLGFLRPNAEGRIVQAEPLVTTGAEMHALHIANYHRAMLERAAASIDLVPSAGRDISAVTILVGLAGVRRVKEKLRRFRREILELALGETDATQVLQLNLQLFPLSIAKDREPGP
jgi:uncharacterized protein (TIGR02147 family)